jgi:hypothetical protein
MISLELLNAYANCQVVPSILVEFSYQGVRTVRAGHTQLQVYNCKYVYVAFYVLPSNRSTNLRGKSLNFRDLHLRYFSFSLLDGRCTL